MAAGAVRRGAVALCCLTLAACGGAADAPSEEYADAPPPAPCAGQQLDEQPYAPPTGASTTALGPQAAPYELQAPAGRPRGVAWR